MRHQLTEADARAALALAGECVRSYRSVDDPSFLAEASVLAGGLPPDVRRAVHAGRLDDTKHAVLVLGNAVDEAALPETPGHWRDANAEASRVHAFLLLLYAALLGDVIGWATQQEGRLVTDVLPMPGYETSLISASSQRELGLHTEDAFSPYRADYVGLYCLRNPEAIPTTVSYVDPLAIPPEIGSVLREPRFHTVPDTSHETARDAAAAGGSDHIAEWRRVPPSSALLGGPADAPVLCIDTDFTAAAQGDAAAASALRWLTGHLAQNTYELVLQPGDVAFLDNRNVVHGRRAFRPRYDGRDRWLKRVNLVCDLRRTRAGRASANSRVIGQH